MIFVTVTTLFFADGLPNKKKLTINGPIVVPILFKLPPKFKRCEPVAGSPNNIAKGCAAVCCNEKPNATTKNAAKIAGNEFALAAGIISNAPTTEIHKP